MKSPRIFTQIACALALFGSSIAVLGCGADGSDEEVTDVRIIANNINVGENVRADVRFSSDGDFGDFGDVSVTTIVVEVSPFLTLQEASFRIVEGDGDGADGVSVDQVLHCPDGRTLALLFLSRDDLRGNQDGGEFELQFNVIGNRPTQLASVGAAAGDGRTIRCSEDFLAQASDGVTVSG